MIDGLKRKFAAGALNALLHSLATNKDTQTSVTGLLAGAVLAIHGLNLAALIAGDPTQIALVASSLAAAGIGFLATKANHDGHTTLLGVIAGVSRAYVGNFTGALTLGMCGYLTNKPVSSAQAAVKTQAA